MLINTRLTIIALFALVMACPRVLAGGFFEVGEITLTNTIDSDPTAWVPIPLTKTYANPVLILGALTESTVPTINNRRSLSTRVRRVGGSFEVGMQSPCENANRFGGVVGASCVPAGGWIPETVTWWVIEAGAWEFPDQTEVEAGVLTVATLRNASTNVDFLHTYSARPTIFHTQNSSDDLDWIATNGWGNGNPSSLPTTTRMRLALEGAEVTNSHGAELVAYAAIDLGVTGVNQLGYNTGRDGGTGGGNSPYDRHSDPGACDALPVAAGHTRVIANLNSMSGGNGGFLRNCDPSDPTTVHVDEDQVRDFERNGNINRVGWFATTGDGFGNLDFLTATQTVSDNNGGVAELGDTLTYTIVITNELNDVDQADNAAPELIVPVPVGTTLVGVPTASSGIFALNGANIEFDGVVARSGTVTLNYQVQIDADSTLCGTNLSSQATLQMDPNNDGANSIFELSDAPGDDGSDADTDNLTGDDDPNLTPVVCADVDLSISKSDGVATYLPGDTLAYQIVVANAAGAGIAADSVVQDNFPINISSASWTCAATAGSSCAASGTGDINDTATVLPGGMLTYTVSAVVSSTSVTDIVNTASVSPATGIADTDTSNNVSTDTDTLVYVISNAAGDVVINEVLYDEIATGVTNNDEFIELYNATTAAIDISQWQLVDANLFAGETDGTNGAIGGPSSSPAFIFPAASVLPAGGYAVVWVGAQTADKMSGADLEFWIGRTNKLANGGETLWLLDANRTIADPLDPGNIVDYVAYGSGSTDTQPPEGLVWNSSSQAALAGSGNGVSISLTPNGVDTNMSACWEHTTSDNAAACPGFLSTVDLDLVNGRITSVANNNNTVPELSINDVTVDEGVGVLTFTVSSSTVVNSDIQVIFGSADQSAIAGDDYSAVSGTATILAGQLTTTVSVPILEDTLDELDETFVVNLTMPVNASIADGQGIGTITDNDVPPALSIDDVTVDESAGTMSFTVSLSAISAQDVSFAYDTTDVEAVAGDDYTTVGTSVTIAAGDQDVLLSVPILEDTLDEIDETFEVTLSAPINATIADGQGIGTITDNDASPTLSINDVTIDESGGTATFIVSLSAISGQDVMFSYATADVEAIAGDDYTAISANETITAGDLSTIVNIPILEDVLDEIDETFEVNLSAPVHATIADGQGFATITDNDSPPTISVNDVAVIEGVDAVASFVVSLSVVSGQDISVTLTTMDGSASAGADYTATTLVLTIPAGSNTVNADVPIVDNLINEATESFSVGLSSPVSATIADDIGVATISDDDPEPALSVNDVSLNEDSGVMTFTVSLSSVSEQDVSFNYATLDDTATATTDYTATSGSTTIAAGAMSVTIGVPLIDDALNENTEQFFLDLNSPVNASIADGRGTGTITDSDALPQISIADNTVDENAGTMSFTVSLDVPSALDVSVVFATNDNTAISGVDYTTTNGTLTIAAGTVAGTITVPIIDDQLNENPEQFFVDLTNPVSATIADNQAVGIINDDDTVPSIAIDDVNVDENAGQVVLTVVLAAPSALDVMVNYATVDDTAIAGTDYINSNASVTVPAGQTAMTLAIPLIDDALNETDERFFVNLSSPQNATIGDDQAVVTINDDDNQPLLSINDLTVAESDGVATLTVAMDRPSALDVTVNYATVDNTALASEDYRASSGTAVIGAGQMETTVSIDLLDDNVVENNEIFEVVISNSVNAEIDDAQGQVVIDDDDTTALSISSSSVAEGDTGTSELIFTVLLSNPSSSEVTVEYLTADGTATVGDNDYVTTSGTLAFAPGVQSQTISVPIVGDTTFESDEQFALQLSSAVGAALSVTQAEGIISNDDLIPDAVINSVAQPEGDRGTTEFLFTVTLSNGSDTRITIEYASADDTAVSNDNDYVAASGSITFAPAQTQQTIAVIVNGDEELEPDEQFFVNLLNPNGAVLADTQGVGTIQNDDSGSVEGQVWLDSDADNVFGLGDSALVGWTIEILLNGDVVTDTLTDAHGRYVLDTLPLASGYEVRAKHPESNVVWVVARNIELGIGATVVVLDFPIDPSGVVYDSVARTPISGAIMELVNSSGAPIASACLFPGQQRQITASDGAYRFDVLIDADATCQSGDTFTIEVSEPEGYLPPPSTLIVPETSSFDPTGRADPVLIVPDVAAPQFEDVTTYYLDFELQQGDPNVIHNHIPLDPLGVGELTLRVSKRAARSRASIGELVRYTIDVENTSAVPLSHIVLSDLTPAGFQYVSGSAQLDGADGGFSVSGSRPVRFEQINVPADGSVSLSYLLRVGAGVTRGDYKNTVSPLFAGSSIGNSASAVVTVTADADFEETTIIGKVFDDQNGNGWQDISEIGVPGVRLVTTTGLLVETDAVGRFHIAGVDVDRFARGRNFILKVDPATLPMGSQFTTENPRVMRITQGLFNRLDFGIQLPQSPPPVKQVEGMLGEVLFKPDSDEIEPEHYDLLVALSNELQNSKNVVLTIEGRAKQRPLALARAQQVASVLRSELGDAFMQHITVKVSDELEWRALAELLEPERIGEIFFELDEDTPIATQTERVAKIAERLAQSEGGELILSGHADSRGSEAYNDRLALKRAQQVEQLLSQYLDSQTMSKVAILNGDEQVRCRLERCDSEGKIVTRLVSFGERQPRMRGTTEAAHRENRRVDVDHRMFDKRETLVSKPPNDGLDHVEIGGRYSMRLNGKGSIWATEDPIDVTPRLAVKAPDWISYDRISDHDLSQGTPQGASSEMSSFEIEVYSNYSAFIHRAEVLVFAVQDTDFVNPVTVVPISWDRATDSRTPFNTHSTITVETAVLHQSRRSDDEFVYFVRAYDAKGNFDQTAPQAMTVLSPLDYANRHRDQNQLQEDVIAAGGLAAVYGKNQLVQQNIPIQGSRLRVNGVGIEHGDKLMLNGIQVPIDQDGKFATEYILPIGHHEIIVEQDVQRSQTVQRQRFPVEVTGKYLFMVALGELTVGQNDIAGSIEPLSADDRFDEDVVIDGRFAMYLKGKIRGKYLVTAQLDTSEEELSHLLGNLSNKNPRSLFRRLDPDRYYPVYGDDSNTVSDTDTLGRFYLRVDWDQSSARWGNYHTGLTGNEFAQYSRSLYGGQFTYNSVASTSLGQNRSHAKLFISEAQTALGHSEFLGTGGSLYYLRHLDIVPGSEKTHIEVRDRDSGRVIENVILERGADYEIDELQGRLILARPLAQIASQLMPTVIRDQPLDGNDVLLLVDYEYLPNDFDTNHLTVGARGKQWLGEHVAIGATYVNENRAGDDYGLTGVDLTLQSGRGTYVKLEAARSESSQTDIYQSINGGLSFAPLGSRGHLDAGEAYGIEARLNALEQGWSTREFTTGLWWRRTDDQFSIARRAPGVNTVESGIEFSGQLLDRLLLAGRVATIERGSDKETAASLQADYHFGQRAELSAELRRKRESLLAGETTNSTLFGAQYSYDISDRLEISVSGQVTIDNDEGAYDNNDSISGAVNWQIGNNTYLKGEYTDGHRGDAARLSLDTKVGENQIYGTYTHSTDDTSLPTALRAGDYFTLGTRSRISNQTMLFAESQYTQATGGNGLVHVFGLDFNPKPGWTFGLTGQKGDLTGFGGVIERTAAGVSAGYQKDSIRWSSRVEFRDDEGADNITQWLSSNSLGLKLNENWRLLGKANYSETQNISFGTGDAKFAEASVGFAYRPVNHNRYNFLGKYTYLYDLQSLGQESAGTDQRSNIVSLEGDYQFSTRWVIGAKYALRKGDLRLDRSFGEWFESTTNFAAVRGRYHVMGRWDLLAEYRWLEVDEDDSARSGYLFGVDRHIGDHVKMGLGYNFTDFSDDLGDVDYDNRGWYLNLTGKY